MRTKSRGLPQSAAILAPIPSIFENNDIVYDYSIEHAGRKRREEHNLSAATYSVITGKSTGIRIRSIDQLRSDLVRNSIASRSLHICRSLVCMYVCMYVCMHGTLCIVNPGFGIDEVSNKSWTRMFSGNSR